MSRILTLAFIALAFQLLYAGALPAQGVDSEVVDRRKRKGC